MQYTKQNPLRCFYAFAGYNSQKMALKRLADNFPGFHHVCVGWSEIDKNALDEYKSRKWIVASTSD